MSNIFTFTPPPILGGTITVASLFMGFIGNNKWLVSVNQTNPTYRIDTIVEITDILSDTPAVNYLSNSAALENTRVTDYIVPLTNNRFLRFYTNNNVELYDLVSNTLELRNSYSGYDSSWSHYKLNDTNMLQTYLIETGGQLQFRYRIQTLDTGDFTFNNPAFTLQTTGSNTSPRLLIAKGPESLIIFPANGSNNNPRQSFRIRYSDLSITALTTVPTTNPSFPVNYGFGTGLEFLARNTGAEYYVSDNDDFDSFAFESTAWRSSAVSGTGYNTFSLSDEYAFYENPTLTTTSAGIIKRTGSTIENTGFTQSITFSAPSGRTIIKNDTNYRFGTTDGTFMYRVTRSNTINNLQLEIFKP